MDARFEEIVTSAMSLSERERARLAQEQIPALRPRSSKACGTCRAFPSTESRMIASVGRRHRMTRVAPLEGS
jgi:hypothetical protein